MASFDAVKIFRSGGMQRMVQRPNERGIQSRCECFAAGVAPRPGCVGSPCDAFYFGVGVKLRENRAVARRREGVGRGGEMSRRAGVSPMALGAEPTVAGQSGVCIFARLEVVQKDEQQDRAD